MLQGLQRNDAVSINLKKAIAAKGPYKQPPAVGGRLHVFKGTIEHWLPKLREMFGDSYFDASITDPPYELGFMSQSWDKAGVSFKKETWEGVFHLLKPGAHLMMYGGRYVHRMMVAVEDAGFETIDKMLWLTGQGFPKGLDLGKASGDKRWNGYKTALKPAYEECVISRVPLAGTYVENVLLYDTGGLNIAGCRIGTDKITVQGGGANHYAGIKSFFLYNAVDSDRTGRYPANIVMSHHPLCRKCGTKKVKSSNFNGSDKPRTRGVAYGKDKRPRPAVGHADADGTETVERWQCVSGCPVRMLDKQTGALVSGVPGVRRSVATSQSLAGPLGLNGRTEVGYADKGGASRFFYLAKVSREERDAGCTGTLKDCDNYGDDEWGKKNRAVAQAVNVHACLKPIDLNRYFSTLILPPKRDTPRRILVVFAGAMSEAIGALLAGWDEVYAIEQDATHCRNGIKRAEHWLSDAASQTVTT